MSETFEQPELFPLEVLFRRTMRRRVSGNCSRCGVWRASLHKDHRVPRFKGGADDWSNIQLLCANCHQDKTERDAKDPAHRAHRRERVKTAYRDPALRKRMSETISRMYAENPALREKVSAGAKRARAQETPESKARRRESLLRAARSPEGRETRSRISKTAWDADPERRERQAEENRRRHSDPVFQERHRRAVKRGLCLRRGDLDCDKYLVPEEADVCAPDLTEETGHG